MYPRKIWLCCLGFSAFFFGCSSDPGGQSFSYLRSPAYFKADTTQTDHPFCADFAASFNSQEDCLKAKKYKLSWLRPENIDQFRGYRIYVDTNPPNAPAGRSNWDNVKQRPELANFIVLSQDPSDSIVFVFGTSGFKTDTVNSGNHRIYVIDTVGRQETKTGQLVFALVPIYGGGVTPGEPQFSSFITDDKFPPDIFSPNIKPMAYQVSIAWARPTDPTSFFDNTLDTGIVRNYVLEITLGGRRTPERRKAFGPAVKYFRGGEDLSAPVTDSLITETSENLLLGYKFFLPDSNRAHKTASNFRDSLRVEISNLTPRDTLNLWLYAIDASGNSNKEEMQSVVVHLTDTTQPSKPLLKIDSTRTKSNSFVVQWTASSDSAEPGGKNSPNPTPNYLIAEYHLRRTLMRGPGEKVSALDQLDTVIQVIPANQDSSVFLDTMRFLPPGRIFALRLSAVDVTGFESLADTAVVTTDSVRFTDADSGLTCPNGFLPIPRGNFTLGDGSASSDQDEKPGKPVTMSPFCIEPYEHRDSSGSFVSNVTWQQADAICKGIDSAHDTQLCSEAEWERACEGPGIGPDSALLHGIQSEGTDASILQTTCNQGTNDSVMAKSFDLRNAACLTREGVYDMAGNYSEWVREPYDENAYLNIPIGDTLTHMGLSVSDSARANPRRAFRGGNFLKPPKAALSTIQNLARCSNRDYAEQVRPIFRDDCKDSAVQKIAIIYSSGLSGHFCMDIPDSLRDAKITDLLPAPRDSSIVYAFVAGDSHPKAIKIAFEDTLFARKKPIAVQLTTRSLAEVSFVKDGSDSAILDTLDATEMTDTSQASLAKIFTREAGNSGWSVKKVDGRFAIRFLYAYAVLGSKPAKPFYSNRAIAFRCCSLAKAPAPIGAAKSVARRR